MVEDVAPPAPVPIIPSPKKRVPTTLKILIPEPDAVASSPCISPTGTIRWVYVVGENGGGLFFQDLCLLERVVVNLPNYFCDFF